MASHTHTHTTPVNRWWRRRERSRTTTTNETYIYASCGHRLLLRLNSIKMAKIYGNLYLHFMETKRCFSVSPSHPIPFIRHSCVANFGYTLFSNSNCVQLTHIFIIFLLLHWNYAVDRHFCCVRVSPLVCVHSFRLRAKEICTENLLHVFFSLEIYFRLESDNRVQKTYNKKNITDVITVEFRCHRRKRWLQGNDNLLCSSLVGCRKRIRRKEISVEDYRRQWRKGCAREEEPQTVTYSILYTWTFLWLRFLVRRRSVCVTNAVMVMVFPP